MARGLTQAEFVEPTPRSRRNFALALALSAVAGVLVFQFAMPAYFRFLETLPACDHLRWMRWTMLGLMFALGGLATVFWVTGARVLRHGRWPLPGAWVWHRTPVRRGLRVRVQGYGLLFAGLLVLGVAVASALALDRLFAQYEERRCTPGGDASPAQVRYAI